jgi:competence protein ComEA
LRKKIKKSIKDYFTFSSGEIRGTILLISFISILIILNWILPYISSNNFSQINDIDMQIVDSLIESNSTSDSVRSRNSKNNNEQKINSSNYKVESEPEQPIINYHPFDPNIVSKEELIQLGFTEKLASLLIKYRNTGAKFKSSSDLKKLYGMSDSFYSSISPYIQFESSTNIPKEKENTFQNDINDIKSNVKTPILIDMNSADSALFTTLNGVGPVIAARIVKLRNRLGAFYSLNQLRDVYGIKEENFELIKNQLIVKDVNCKKININTCSFDELKSHAYFDYKTSKAIINYREANGKYQSVDDIKSCELITEDFIDKNRMYIRID